MLEKIQLSVLGILVTLLFIAPQCGANATEPSGHDPTETGPELSPLSLSPEEKLKVMATTSIVADVVSNIGDDRIDLIVLLPIGTDPHTFEPTPRDLASVADAHIIFANGMGLEEFLDEMIENAGGTAEVIYVSRGVEAREFGGAEDDELEADQDEHEGKEGNHFHQEGADPHVWTTPTNVMTFVTNIQHALSTLDPAHAETYAANAETYQAKLEELDVWVKEQIATIPTENRELVTDHTVFGYYADRYGLQQIGAVIPAVSTGAVPSAKELSELEAAIKGHEVKAIFVGTSVNPSLSERVANDTGVKLVTLYTGSLGEAGSGVESYLDYVRYNTEAIVEALK